MKIAFFATLLAVIGAAVETVAIPSSSEALSRRASYASKPAGTRKVIVVKVAAPATARKIVVVKKPVNSTRKIVIVKKPATSSKKILVVKAPATRKPVPLSKPPTSAYRADRKSTNTNNFFGINYAPSEYWKNLVVGEHNGIRARVGYSLKPLVWDDYWGKKSCLCAQKKADASTVTHCNAGENLWFTTNRKLTDDQIVKYAMNDFEEEKSLYRPGEPINAKKGYGHFTQIAWSDTKRVGCCIRYGRRGVVLSCLYDPVGNYKGDQAYGR